MADKQPGELKSYRVTTSDGIIYSGVKARSKQEAIDRMTKGPQGVLAPKPEQTLPEQEHARIQQNMVDILKESGMSEEDAQKKAAQVGKKIPGSWTAVGGALLPMLIGSVFKPGRTVTRIAGPLAANIAGRAILEGGAAAANDEDAIKAGLQGAIHGILPGIVQSAASGILGPSKDTLRTQKAIAGIRQEVSPQVAATLDAATPGNLLHPQTLRAMGKAASDTWNPIEGIIDANLANTKFQIGNRPETYASLREQIRNLRELSDAQRMNMLRGEAAKNKKLAGQLESDMLRQMRQQGQGATAEMYEKGLAQYERDMSARRFVMDLQNRNKLFGGANAQAQPGLADAQEALMSGKKASTMMHGALGAAEAAMGKTVGAGWQFSRAADQMKGGPLRPAAQAPVYNPLTAAIAPPPLLAAAASGGQSLFMPSAAEAATADLTITPQADDRARQAEIDAAWEARKHEFE